MGVVCKYRNATLNKFAAVKMIKTKDLSETVMMRFQREGQAAARLQHPGIVGVHDLGVTEYGDPYMIMDYFEGETLEDLLKRKYQFSLRQLETIFIQCAEALEHAHSQGVLHRDIKPSNIMVTNLKSDQLVIKILDFGIAKILDEDGEFTTTTGANAGSPLYMSPEQSQGSTLDARTDIYSLGCVFYAALAGQPPFSGKNALELSLQHQKEKPVPITQIPHLRACPPDIADTVMRMLEKDPLKRPQTMKEVCSLLKRGVKAAKASSIRGGRNPVWLLPVVAFVITVLLVALAFYLYRPREEDISRESLRKLQDKVRRDPIVSFSEDPVAGGQALAVLSRQQTPVIDLSHQYFTSADMTKLQQDKKLKELTIQDSRLSDEAVQIIGRLPNLRLLSLEGNKQVSDDGIAAIANMTSLEDLNLKKTNMTDASAFVIAKLPKLSRLNIDSTAITDKGIAIIASNNALKELFISNTPITDNALRSIAKMPNLNELKVGCNSITARGIAYLDAAPSLLNLSMHYADESNLKNTQAVAKLRKLVHYETPDDFTDAEAKVLGEKQNWEMLRLDGIKMTPKVLDGFKSQKHLKLLRVVGALKDNFPEANIFRKEHPNCILKIEYSPWLRNP